MNWSVEILDDRVRAELAALPKDARASFERIVTMIVAHGLEQMRQPQVKHLEGP